MAIMSPKSNMVFWKIKIQGNDFTSMLSKYVSSIKVTDKIFPTNPLGNRKSGDAQTPSNAVISVTSHDYIEAIFTEGAQIEIYMGYDRINPPLIFRGKINRLPDGSAKDMLNYDVNIPSNEIALAYEEKNRVFQVATKTAIIAQIAAENNLISKIIIQDTRLITIPFSPMQRAVTDLELLMYFADQWDCICWFEPPNLLYFFDSNKGHVINKVPYMLGYRTDYVKSNIETITWKHRPPRAATVENPGMVAFNEDGETATTTRGRFNAYNQTWELRQPYAAESNISGENFGTYARTARNLAFAGQGRRAVTTYFQVGRGGNRTNRDSIPQHASSGFEFDISLNEGDPTLKPPRAMYLYAGTNNPRVDTSHLPNWIFRHSPGGQPPALLKLNETELTYSEGRIQQKLTCTIDGSGK